MRIGTLVIKMFFVGAALLFFMSAGLYVARTEGATSSPLVLVSSVYSSTGEVEKAETSFVLLDTILEQVERVLSFASVAAQTVLALPSDSSEEGTDTASIDESFDQSGTAPQASVLALGNNNKAETLQINVPFVGTDALYIEGVSNLATTTIQKRLTVNGQSRFNTVSANAVSVLGAMQSGSLNVAGDTQLTNLAVAGRSNLATAVVSGTLDVGALVRAIGGVQTNGADIDLSGGNIFAANVVNELVAGSNITISGTPNAPIISARRSGGGSNDTLATARARAGCDECVTDSDIVPALTITGGSINNTPIGVVTPAEAIFTDVTVGTTTASSTLALYGRLIVDGSGENSTFSGGINVTDGCVAVDGICLGGGVASLDDLTDVTLGTTTLGNVLIYDGASWVNVATSSLGFGDGTFLSLADTPSTYIANALLYANAAGDAVTQSANLSFDGARLGVGTSSPLETLSIAGTAGILGQESLRFYNAANTNYVGFRASSSVSSDTIWSLPASDGTYNQLLVTDGFGNLSFADVGSVGGGSATYIGLTDTPSSYVNKAIPYVDSGALAFASNFTFDGTRLGLGNIVATSTLSVEGSVRFQAATTTIGLVYDENQNRIGIGADNPTQLLDIEGGSLIQRGARIGSTYRPTQIASLDAPDNINDLFVAGSRAYIVTSSAGSDFQIIDVSNDTAPTILGSENLAAGANGVFVAGQYAYVVTDVVGDDFHVIDITDESNPTEVGSLDLSTTGFGVFVQGRYAYVVTAGAGDDFHIIDIADPTAPVEVGSLDLPDATNAVAVRGDYAYVATDALGDDFHVIDISDPTTPVENDSLDLPTAVNDVVLQGNYAFLVSDSTGDDFHVIDISDPSDVAQVGSLNLSTSANAVSVVGRYAYVVTAGTGEDLHVINISSPASPREVGSEELASGAGLGIAASGRNVYVSTSALGDDFHVFDVTGLEVQSAYVSSLESGSFSTVGNMLVSGGLSLGEGLRSGMGGIQTDGSLFVQGTSASFIKNNLGVGTTSAAHTLTVGGDVQITGALYDSSNSAGTAGMVLQSTASGVQWVATSSLGISGDSGGISLTFGTDNQIPYTNAGGTDYEYSSNFTFDGSQLTLAGDFYPGADDTYTLGSTTARWQDVFVGPDTLHIGSSLTDEGTLSYDTAANVLNFNTDSTTNGDIVFFDDDLFIDKATGFVGIGTTTPASALHIEGAVRATQFIGLDDSNFYINPAGASQLAGPTYLSTVSGSVGIGTTSPLAKLDVYGDAMLSGSDRYLNFGTTAGSAGYGIRDNAGVMEYKDAGGEWTPLNSTIQLTNIQAYDTSSSSYVWNKPADFSYATVEVWGGGGGSGRLTSQGGGGGGGGGGYTSITLDEASLNASYTVYVGEAGGPGGNDSGGSGGSGYYSGGNGDAGGRLGGGGGGGSSAFGTLLIAAGGSGGGGVGYGANDYGGGGGGGGGITGNGSTATGRSGANAGAGVVGIGAGGSGGTSGYGSAVDGDDGSDFGGGGGGGYGGNDGDGGDGGSAAGGDGGESYDAGGAGGSGGNAFGGESNSIGGGGGGGGSTSGSGSTGGTGGAAEFRAGAGAAGTRKAGQGGGNDSLSFGDGGSVLGESVPFGDSGQDGAVIVYEYSATSSGADLAELYPVTDQSINAGDIVAFDSGLPITVTYAQKDTQRPLAGVISTKPGLLLGDTQNPSGQRPVALAGRVPTKVNQEGGPITIGDRIALSSEPGVGKKASAFEPSVGIAIASVQHTQQGDTVMLFLDLQEGIDIEALGEALLATTTASNTDSFDFVGTLLTRLMERMGFEDDVTATRESSDTTTASATTAPDSLWSRLMTLAKGFVDGVLSVASLIVGTSEEPSGITLYDEETGEPYCIKVSAGALLHREGVCQQIDGEGQSATEDAASEDTQNQDDDEEEDNTNDTDGEELEDNDDLDQNDEDDDSGDSNNNQTNTIKPIITLSGDNPVTLAVGDDYQELGATASSSDDIDITNGINIDDSDVNTSATGTYDVIYTVTDSNDNSASTTREVIVEDSNVDTDGQQGDEGGQDIDEAAIPEDTTAPTISGAEDIVVPFESIFEETAGITAIDDDDTNLTNEITVSGSVNTDVVGAYELTYMVEDDAGNTAYATRIVTVEAQQQTPNTEESASEENTEE